MTNRSKVHALAKRLGATIEGGRFGNTYSYNIDAPRGFTWASDCGLHTIVAWTYIGTKDWTDKMWADALDRMEYGVEPCEVTKAEGACEFCDDDENWTNPQ